MNKQLLVMTMCAALGALPLSAQVTIEGSETVYETLYDAAQAAETNATIIVSGEVNAMNVSGISTAVAVGDRILTIKGENNAVVNYSGIFVASTSVVSSSLTIENLTFQNTNPSSASGRNTFSFGRGNVYMNNVNIKDANVSHASGIISLTGSNDNLKEVVLNNVKIENGTVTTAPAEVVIGTDNVTLKGDSEFSFKLQGTRSIKNAAEFSGHATLVLDADRALNSVVVKECQDITHFTLSGREGCSLQANKDGNLILVEMPAIYNEVTGAGFTTLNNAISNSESGSTIILSQDAILQSRPDVSAKSLTIKGTTTGVKIIRGANFPLDRYLFLLNNEAGDLTLENLTIDGDNIATTAALIQPDKGAKLTMKNVNIVNCKATTGRGLIDNNGDGSWHLEGVSFDNCMVKRPSATNDVINEDTDTDNVSEPLVSANGAGNSITGNNNLTLLISGENSIDAEGVSNETPIDVKLSSPNEGFTYFTNCSDVNKFNCLNSGFKFAADGENLKLAKDENTGIEDIDADNEAEAVWYNLNGIRVNPNTPGLYIKVEGDKATKVYVK